MATAVADSGYALGDFVVCTKGNIRPRSRDLVLSVPTIGTFWDAASRTVRYEARWTLVPTETRPGRGIQGAFQEQTAMKRETKSLEECLKEAAECERLADLARLDSTRRALALSASYWRELAVRAAQRDRTSLH